MKVLLYSNLFRNSFFPILLAMRKQAKKKSFLRKRSESKRNCNSIRVNSSQSHFSNKALITLDRFPVLERTTHCLAYPFIVGRDDDHRVAWKPCGIPLKSGSSSETLINPYVENA